MKNVLIWIIKAVFAAICSVVILSAFCLLYNYEGIHIKTESGATDYNWESGQFKSTMKEGFSWINVDKYGYNNANDNSKSPDILLMGSSHVEGLQVKLTENMGYLLDELLDNLSVYNIGMSGHTVYRCVDNLENAVKAYNPKKYVVILIDGVKLDEASMQQVINGDAMPIPSYSSGIMYATQKIPFIKSAYNQLSEWVSLDAKRNNDDNTQEAESSQDAETEIEKSYTDTLSEFLDKAKDSVSDNCKLVIVSQSLQSLDESGKTVYSDDKEMLDVFSSLCKEKGVAFCSLTSSFEKLYKEKNILAHGFSNTAVGAGHLNKHGHRVTAETIADLIDELEKE